jgi:hypothetical protein
VPCLTLRTCRLAAAKSIWSQRSYFHRDLDAARGDGLVEDLLQSRLDQDRIKFAEDYADIILELTDLKDAYWFRRGVWKKETLPETIYPRQRDHSVHTAHNYLLGWYFFTRCRPITEQLRRSFESRNLEATFEPSFADSFGGLWCFVSLLHDIGYLFEGSVPDEGTAGVDEGIRFGAEYASSYFTNIFWKECKLPRIDDRIIAQRLFGLSTVPIDATSPHSIISYLRDSGAATLGGALGIPDLPSDAFTLWATNYRHFGQREMATRMENLTTALDAFVDQGLPGATVRVLDHGVCGGLLLLKYSTLWFCLYEALNRAPPAADVRDEDVRNKLLTACNRRSPVQLIGGSRWYGRLQLSPCITFNRPKAGPLNRLGSTKTLWLTSAFWSTFCKSGIVIRYDALVQLSLTVAE